MSVNVTWVNTPEAKGPLLPVSPEREWQRVWSGLDKSRFKVLRQTLPLDVHDTEEKEALLEDLALCRELIPAKTNLHRRIPGLIAFLRENMDAEYWTFG